MAFEALFQPIQVGKVKLKNRYICSPLNFIFNDWCGFMNDTELFFWLARAMGGVAAVDFGAVLTTELGRKMAPHPWIHMTGLEHVPGLAFFTESIHLAGAKAIIQVLPSASARSHTRSGLQGIAPTGGIIYPWVTIPSKKMLEVIKKGLMGVEYSKAARKYTAPRAVSKEEIKTMIMETARNCKLAVLAGFDGVEIHACHHYLVDMFRDPRFNKRTDEYGGSADNRNRFALELTEAVIKSVKEERPDMAVGIRIGCDTVAAHPWPDERGYTLEETKVFAKQLEELGIDFCHITTGIPHPYALSGPKDPDGQYLNWARKLKKVLEVPLITTSVHDPKLAEQAVAEGITDIISLGRPLIADPDFVNKVKEGRIKDIRKCNKDNACWLNFEFGLPGRCTVNPEVGRERFNPKYHQLQGFRGKKMYPYVLRERGKGV